MIEKAGPNKTPGDIIWGANRTLLDWSQKNYRTKSSFAPRSVQLVETADDIIEKVAEYANQSSTDNFETTILSDEAENILDETIADQLQEIATGTLISERLLMHQANECLDHLVQTVVDGQMKKFVTSSILQDRIEKKSPEPKCSVSEFPELLIFRLIRPIFLNMIRCPFSIPVLSTKWSSWKTKTIIMR